MVYITDEVMPYDIINDITAEIISDITDEIISPAEQILNKGYQEKVFKAGNYFCKQLQFLN